MNELPSMTSHKSAKSRFSDCTMMHIYNTQPIAQFAPEGSLTMTASPKGNDGAVMSVFQFTNFPSAAFELGRSRIIIIVASGMIASCCA